MAKKIALCVQRTRLEKAFGGTIPIGFSVGRDFFETAADVFKKSGKFLEREIIESDEKILQVIVYGIVSDGKRVLGLVRKNREKDAGEFKETRLNNKIGLAAGGHVDSVEDLNESDFFGSEMLREFSEELTFSEPPKPVPIGIVMYEETSIDRVHMGLIYKVVAKENSVRLAQNNDEYDRCMFLLPADLEPIKEQMEGWGKVIAEAIVSGRFKLD